LKRAPPPRPLLPLWDQLQERSRSKDATIDQRLHPKQPPVPSSLPKEDEQYVDVLMQKSGIISKFAREQVNAADIARLKPTRWLNDEIINFYGAMLLERSEKAAVKAGKNGKSNLPNVHYFSTFFYQKLATDGYDKARLAKWTKKVCDSLCLQLLVLKVTQIDIFAKDMVLIPINHGNAHWTAAIINFKQKRIESYDSIDGRYPHLFKVCLLTVV
jgi:sentrin-specific protease 1